MSWEDIDNPQKKVIRSHDDEKFNYLIYQVFNSEFGKQLLCELKTRYVNTSVCPFDRPASYGYFREGQNNIIREFEKRMNQHLSTSKKG